MMLLVIAAMAECDSNPCVVGFCSEGINGYTCECLSGFTGTNCDMGTCFHMPLKNTAILGYKGVTVAKTYHQKMEYTIRKLSSTAKMVVRFRNRRMRWGVMWKRHLRRRYRLVHVRLQRHRLRGRQLPEYVTLFSHLYYYYGLNSARS